MPKPISQRGFEIIKRNSNGIIRYCIDPEGFENITILMNKNHVSIGVDNEKIIGVKIETLQAKLFSFKDYDSIEGVILDDSLDNHLNMPTETNTKNYEQAMEIYKGIIKSLDIVNKIKKYRPKNSSESELTLYNILGVENAHEFESKIEKEI